MNKSSKVAMIGSLIAGFDITSPLQNKPDWINNINISKEYELIKQKKSKLSRSQRETIVKIYEK